jgi:hypothetical protein
MVDLLERLRRIVKMEEVNLEKDIKNKNINMVSAITKSGLTLYTDAEAMAVGVEIYTLNGEEKVKVETGDYELEDGSVVVVDDNSVIAEIKEGDVEETEDVDAGYDEKKDDDEDKDKNEKQNVDGYDARAEFEAVKGMLENISMKLDALIGEKMSAVEQSITELTEKVNENEVKLEKISVENEMKSVETIDDVKKVAQNAVGNKKRHLDYNTITRLNKKF